MRETEAEKRTERGERNKGRETGSAKGKARSGQRRIRMGERAKKLGVRLVYADTHQEVTLCGKWSPTPPSAAYARLHVGP